jgi:hypothetical protein
MPILEEEIAYQVVLDSSVDLDPVTSQTDEGDLVLNTIWPISSSCSRDYLNDISIQSKILIEEVT